MNTSLMVTLRNKPLHAFIAAALQTSHAFIRRNTFVIEIRRRRCALLASLASRLALQSLKMGGNFKIFLRFSEKVAHKHSE